MSDQPKPTGEQKWSHDDVGGMKGRAKRVAEMTKPTTGWKVPEDLLEWAWTIIANAHGGDWDKESEDWQNAAIQWRDSYFGSLPKVSQSSSEQSNANRPPNQPKPTTGEWTAQRIFEFLGLHSKHTEAASFLADAINKALAAEREKVQSLVDALVNISYLADDDIAALANDALAEVKELK